MSFIEKVPEINCVSKAFYSIRFWQFFALMVLGNFFGTFFSYEFKPFGEYTAHHPGVSDQLLTWASSIGGGLVNGSTRLGIGFLIDKHGFRIMFGTLMLL